MKLKNTSKKRIRKSLFYLIIIYIIFSITFYYSLKNSTKIDNTKLYISGGIGNSVLNFRLFNKPSFNLYRLVDK